jgi:hypothetical protein
MTNQPQPSAHAPTIVMAMVLIGAAIIAVLGTILPSLFSLSGTPAIILRLAFYAVAVLDVVLAFWVRGKLRKSQPASRSGGTVQRQ